jgi:uncharacterized protein (DUF1499 family)
MVNGRLRPCPGGPNCVSSEERSGPFSVEPLASERAFNVAWGSLKRVFRGMGGKLEQENDDDLWATFRTRVFRFMDGLECRMDVDNNVV